MTTDLFLNIDASTVLRDAFSALRSDVDFRSALVISCLDARYIGKLCTKDF